VAGCTRTKQTAWTEDQFTVTSREFLKRKTANLIILPILDGLKTISFEEERRLLEDEDREFVFRCSESLRWVQW
jgi:hypothetical protein